MAESESGQDKTEEPTEKRRREARKKGQLPRSRELNTLSVLMAGAGALLVYGAHLAEVLMGVMRNSFEMSRETAMRSESMLQLLGTAARGAAEGLWPILLVLLCAAVIGPIALGGWLFSGEALAPKFSRMNPLEGIKRMFSAKSVLELFKALIKFVVVLAVAVLVLRSDKEALPALLHQPLQTAIVESVKGAVITEVAPDSAAAERGIVPGDVIVEIGQEAVASADEVKTRIAKLKSEDRRNVLMMVANHSGALRYITVRID